MENISFYIWIVCFILMSPTVKNAEENLASKLRAERMHRMKYFEIVFQLFFSVLCNGTPSISSFYHLYNNTFSMSWEK